MIGSIICDALRGDSGFETVINTCLALALLLLGIALAVAVIMIHQPLGISATAAVVLLLLRRVIGRRVFGGALMLLGVFLFAVVLFGGESWNPTAYEIEYSQWVGGMRRDPCGPRELELFISIAFLLVGGHALALKAFRRTKKGSDEANDFGDRP